MLPNPPSSIISELIPSVLPPLSLEPFAPFFRARHDKYTKWVKTINQHEGGLDKFTRGWQGEKGFVSTATSSWFGTSGGDAVWGRAWRRGES